METKVGELITEYKGKLDASLKLENTIKKEIALIESGGLSNYFGDDKEYAFGELRKQDALSYAYLQMINKLKNLKSIHG